MACQLLFTPAQEELGDFLRDGGSERETDHHAPFTSAEEVGVENGLEERHGAHDHHQGDGCPDRVLHVLVGEKSNGEDRGAFRADSVSTEQFTERQSDKRHCLGGLHVHTAPIVGKDIGDHVRAIGDDRARLKMPDQAHYKSAEYCAGLHDGLDDDAKSHRAVDNRLGFGARLLVHDVGVALFHCQSKRGSAVSDQVEPQQLNGCQRGGQTCQSREEDDHDFRDVGREQEEHELADVRVDDASLLHGGDDAGVVVVGQHHVGCAFGDIGAGDAHRHADVGAFDGGRVVHAVAGHGDHFIVGLQGVHDAHLVLGRDAGKDIGVFDDRLELFVVNGVEFRACHDLFAWAQQTDGLGNRAGSVREVACDHHGADACMARMFERGFDLGARRVDHAHQTDEDQILFKVFGLDLFDVVRYVLFQTISKAEHTQGIFGHRIVGGEDLLAHGFGHLARLVIHALIFGAQSQHDVGRALHHDHVPVLVGFIVERRNVVGMRSGHVMNGNHALAL